ncbi:D-alanyl-D-alanine endopeptidase [Massilia forsythiae]|uniref:D-alanyl-D-alanine endopeptidase n=1 Tax=Massilia forsythiae TaxID=2728020 RepID=A0A7Z2ZT01_9BURK|nr:D-alanyl-D-alanine endopeptidase [Massilia forsythiae]QJE00849.1 D-alanyl-D-alanine endopeptidase [Massilia forsythiae]
MLKLALTAAISMMLVFEPVAAEAKSKGRTAVVKRIKVKKHEPAKLVASDNRQRLVRRVIKVRGKRKVVYEQVRRAAPALAILSAGDLAGLNLTHDPLALRSSVAYVLDQDSSEVLFEKNSSVALPIASITKLMTGFVVVQAHQNLDEILTVTEDDVDHHKFTSSRLQVGTRMTRGDLLHIALMSSENRAAAALGRNYPGGINAFVAAMNAKARELSMNNTHYVDSSGLSSQNVSSARDLAKLVSMAHHEPLLRQYTTDPNYVVEAGGRALRYSNTNYLVAMPDWNIGLQKTGFINEAGRCLVMQAMIQGRNVVMVFLDSKGKQSRTADAGRMRRWLEAIKPPVIPAAAAAGVPVTVSAGAGVGVGAAPLVQ